MPDCFGSKMPASAGTIINDDADTFIALVRRRLACGSVGARRFLGASECRVLSKDDLLRSIRRISTWRRRSGCFFFFFFSSTGSPIPRADTCLLSRWVGLFDPALVLVDDWCDEDEPSREEQGILTTESMMLRWCLSFLCGERKI